MTLHFFSPHWELGDQTPLKQADNTYPRRLQTQTCSGRKTAPALLRVSYCREEQCGSCALAHPWGLAEAYQQPLPLELSDSPSCSKELKCETGSLAIGNHLHGVTVLLLSWFVLTATHSRSQAVSSAPSPSLGSDTASSPATGGQLHTMQIMEAENPHPFTPEPLTKKMTFAHLYSFCIFFPLCRMTKAVRCTVIKRRQACCYMTHTIIRNKQSSDC